MLAMKKAQLLSQHGAALLLMLIMLLLAVATVVLSALNDRHDYQLLQQQQTQQALQQAKQALIGYASSYDKTHTNTNGRVGYLPCPDISGDGSANTPCGNSGETALGRLPWRTLGIPPLRDGSGECLWYAVSGKFKSSPSQTITSNTDGDIIIQDIQGNTLHGSTALNRAIAVVFAPNTIIASQTREGGGASNKTGCSYKDSPTQAVSQASNYLDTANSINNATGGVLSSVDINGNRLFVDTNLLDNNYPTFVQAMPQHNAIGAPTFNDVLAVLSPKDFAPVFKLMDYNVLSQATTCISDYFKDNRTAFFNDYAKPLGNLETPATKTYRAESSIKSEITLYVEEMVGNCSYHKCSQDCTTICETQKNNCVNQCNITFKDDTTKAATCSNKCLDAEKNCLTNCGDEKQDCADKCASTSNKKAYKENAINVSANYPWTAGLDNPNYKEKNGQRFGRIPSVLSADATDDVLSVASGQNIHMAESWPIGCFNEKNWTWWQDWKEHIFYALDDEYAPTLDTYIWIKSARKSTKIGTGSDMYWELELWSDYKNREATRKVSTAAILTDSTQANGWSLTTIPTPTTTATTLRLVGSGEPEFAVFAAGRRLALNQGSATADYNEFTQVRDADAFCATNFGAICNTCKSTPYASGCYKSRIDNYLEGEAHSSLPLRKVQSGAMQGGNIPTPYSVAQPLATIPSGDEKFVQDSFDIEFFTDFSCYSKSNCKSVYKK